MDALDDLLSRVDAGELGDPLPVLAYIAGQAVEIDEGDLNGGRRRALLLVAAGGGPPKGPPPRDPPREAPPPPPLTHQARPQVCPRTPPPVLPGPGRPGARAGG